MSSSVDVRAEAYDGADAAELSRRLGVPRVELFDRVSSTLDVAHAIAPLAPSGTLILAEEQVAGRGRQGRRWTSQPGAGIWLTLIERPRSADALDVLALRCGLRAAAALDALAPQSIKLKWPNDLYSGECKLAGILIETRWRGTSPEWVAIGFGLNVITPGDQLATGLRTGVSRLSALELLVSALRSAVNVTGPLTNAELNEWALRDLAAGRVVTAPGEGLVQGITASGEIAIREANDVTRTYRSGSLIFATPLSCS